MENDIKNKAYSNFKIKSQVSLSLGGSLKRVVESCLLPMADHGRWPNEERSYMCIICMVLTRHM